MKHLEAGAFCKLDFTDTALCYDGIDIGGFEQIEEGIPNITQPLFPKLFSPL